MFKIKKITTDIPAAPQTIPLTLLQLINTKEMRGLYPSKHPAMTQWELAFRQMEDVTSSNWKNTHPAGAEKVNTGLLSQGREMVPSEADGPEIASGELLGGINAARAAENAHTDLQSPKGETTRPEAEGAEIASEGLPGKRRLFPWEGVPIAVGEGRQEWERLRSSRAKKGSCRNPLLEETISPDTLKLCAKQCRELDSIPERARTLLLSLLRHASFTFKTGNLVVHPTGSTKDTILLECGWLNKVAMARNIKILCQCGAVEMLMRGAYKINPRYKVLLEESREFIIDPAEPPTHPALDAGSDKTNEDPSGSQEGLKPLLWDEMKPFMTDEYLASIGESRETPAPANAGSGITDGEDSGDMMTHPDGEASEIVSKSNSGVPERWLPLLASLRKLAGDGNEAYIGDSEEPFLGFSSKAVLYRGLTALRECGVIRALGWGKYLLLDGSEPESDRPSEPETPAETFASNGTFTEPSPEPAEEENGGSASAETSAASAPSADLDDDPSEKGIPQTGENDGETVGRSPKKFKKVFAVLCQRAGKTGIVTTGGSAADEIAAECGWKNKNSLFAGLVFLCECGAIEQLQRGTYRISPDFQPDIQVSAEFVPEESSPEEAPEKPTEVLVENAADLLPCRPIPFRWERFFQALCRKTGDDGLIHTGGAAASELAIECGWSGKSSVFVGLKALCDCGAIRQIEKGIYQANPQSPQFESPSRGQRSFKDEAERTNHLVPTKPNIVSSSIPKEALFKQSVIEALRKYRKDNGLGCLNALSENAKVPVDRIRMMLESHKVDYSTWIKVGKALGVEEVA